MPLGMALKEEDSSRIVAYPPMVHVYTPEHRSRESIGEHYSHFTHTEGEATKAQKAKGLVKGTCQGRTVARCPKPKSTHSSHLSSTLENMASFHFPRSSERQPGNRKRDNTSWVKQKFSKLFLPSQFPSSASLRSLWYPFPRLFPMVRKHLTFHFILASLL